MKQTFAADNTHIVDLYNKWKQEPDKYGNEIANVIDKIIYSTISNKVVLPYYWRFESKEDLLQDIRLMCIRQLNRIENPTNKRIFNYIKVSVKYYLRDRARRVGRKMDNDAKQITTPPANMAEETICLFPDPVTNQIATYLAMGTPRVEICKLMKISYKTLQAQIELMKENLNDRNS